MTGGDEDNSPDDARDDDELASKLVRLTEEQHTRYQIEVQNNIDRNAEANRDYRLSLANTLLKNFPAREESSGNQRTQPASGPSGLPARSSAHRT